MLILFDYITSPTTILLVHCRILLPLEHFIRQVWEFTLFSLRDFLVPECSSSHDRGALVPFGGVQTLSARCWGRGWGVWFWGFDDRLSVFWDGSRGWVWCLFSRRCGWLTRMMIHWGEGGGGSNCFLWWVWLSGCGLILPWRLTCHSTWTDSDGATSNRTELWLRLFPWLLLIQILSSCCWCRVEWLSGGFVSGRDGRHLITVLISGSSIQISPGQWINLYNTISCRHHNK